MNAPKVNVSLNKLIWNAKTINVILGFHCLTLVDLVRLREVSKDFCDVIDNYAYNVWFEVLLMNHQCYIQIVFQKAAVYPITHITTVYNQSNQSNGDNQSKDMKLLSHIMSGMEKGNMEMIRVMIQNGFDINTRNEAGHNALSFICRGYSLYISNVLFLLENGSEIPFPDITLSHIISLNVGKEGWIFDVWHEIVDVILERGIELPIYDERGKSLIARAFEKKSHKLVKYYLDKGCDYQDMIHVSPYLRFIGSYRFRSESGNARIENLINEHIKPGSVLERLCREPVDILTIDELKVALEDYCGFTDFQSLPWKGTRKQPLYDKLKSLVKSLTK